MHRSILSKDNSVFGDMFLTYIPESNPDLTMNTTTKPGEEGLSDQNPIDLTGDTVEEFRSLLWSLYAL